MDFPYADAAGIIRANQKDAFVESSLQSQIKDVLQAVKGVRFTHNWATHIQAFSTLLYLSLTSLVGSRTLGEEYTDIFYLTHNRKIPSNVRVGLYVLTSGFSPLLIPKLTLKLKNLVRKLVQTWSAKSNTTENHVGDGDDDDDDEDEEEPSFWEEHLTPATLVSLNLTIFYFSGAYYQLSKRLFGLRYAFGHRVDLMAQPAGSYELIGVLMILRALLKVVEQIKSQLNVTKDTGKHHVNVQEIGTTLDDESVLPFIHEESRRCNLCLENMRAPTVTLCGHMYCWSCISGWCREQSECPLCRQECQEQHLLCLRV